MDWVEQGKQKFTFQLFGVNKSGTDRQVLTTKKEFKSVHHGQQKCDGEFRGGREK